MKKHRFLSACLSLSLLTNTTNCFCVSKSEGKEPDSTKTANIKKVVASKPVKMIGGIGAGLLGAVGIYESACHIGYKINVKKIQENMEQLVSSAMDKPFDFTQEKITSLSL